jgi:redox-sensitive bicupin YhaK (pirin superfamily)
MKTTVRRSADRGHFDHGWLQTHHTFSFGDYRDPRHMGFSDLRVINEDVVQAGQGFSTHGHRDMEIVTYVLRGALEHRDSMGNGSVIRPGEVQLMSAGTGVTHSEENPSRTEDTHLLQIWILPARTGTTPRYEQREFPEEGRRDALQLVVSPDGADGSLTIGQDASIHAGLLSEGKSMSHALAPGRRAWVQIATGAVRLGDELLRAGDGAAVEDASEIALSGVEHAELLLFDLA